MDPHFAQRLSFGARLEADERTVFQLWAPAARSVALEIDGARPLPMGRDSWGFYNAAARAPAGTRYRFRIDDEISVPDPAARAQDGDVHGYSVVTDPHAWTWRNPGWRGRPWHEAVIYETHVGLEGGFGALARRLPTLAALGVTAVELMPVADFPGPRNWGYDGVLPFAPDAAYGSPDELKALVDAAHDLNLMIFLDVVYNHFGPDGNYLSRYAPDFFHPAHTPWGSAINVEHETVSRFFVENALYWLNEFRFDGLRFDAVHAIENPAWLDRLGTAIRRGVESGRHVHLVLEHDGNAARHLPQPFDAQWNDDWHHAMHVLLTGESDGYYADYADAPAQHLARCLGEGFAWQGEPSPHRDGARRGEPSGHLPPSCFVAFLQNHDQTGNRALGDRIAKLADPEALRAATALLLLSPQPPLLFYGQEWGSRRPFLYFTSHTGDLAEAVRKGRQAEFARFTSFSGQSLPDPNDIATFEASLPSPADEADADDWLALHGSLLVLRHGEIVPRIPGARTAGARAIGPAAVEAAWNFTDGTRLTILCNLAAEPVAAEWPRGRIIYGAEKVQGTTLAAYCTVAWLYEPKP
jgi:malto-oligosyltrehalose trehalohydrolase